MTDNNTHENNFRFILFQDDEIINERIMNANYLNPSIRYSVDIRDQIKEITRKLEKVLSRRNLMYVNHGYDNLQMYKDNVDFYQIDDNILQNNVVVQSNYGNKKGVELKFGLYINENTIVERNFFVENYNPASRFSSELYEVVADICENIFESLKILDVKYMWDDKLILDLYYLNSYQLKDLSNHKRDEMIQKSDDKFYVRKTRSFFKDRTYNNTIQ